MVGKDKTDAQKKKYTPVTKDKEDATDVLKDTELIKKRIKELEKNIERMQINSVEFLGIFTAILAFIVVFIQASIKLKFIEMLILMPVLALVLLVFVIGIDFIIKNDSTKKYLVVSAFLVILIIAILSLAIGFNLIDWTNQAVNITVNNVTN